MVYVGPTIKQTRRRSGRPTQFETQLEMAKISWAPVLECLSLLDTKKYNSIEEIPPPPDEFSIDLGEMVIEGEKIESHKQIRWISSEQIKIIHDDLIETFGGEPGIADITQLDAIIDRAKNSKVFGHDPLYTVVHKAAFIMHSLLRYHQFVDGQKRTGLSSAFIFLGLNGYTFWSRNVLKEVHFCIETTQGKHDVEDIAKWLSNRILNPEKLEKGNIINKLIEVRGGLHIQCTNQDCRGPILPKTYRTKCPKCGRQYELRIVNVVLTHGLTPHATFNIGLHKLEDLPIVTSGVVTLNKFGV